MEVYNDQTAAAWLKIYGYLPGYAAGELDVVPMESMFIENMQAMYASHDLKVDGLCGKLTRAAMNLPRCAWPDAVDDELADLLVNPISTKINRAAAALNLTPHDLQGICAMHLSMRSRANNQYRWPLECSQNLVVDYDTSRCPSSLDAEWIWQEVRQAHATLGIGVNRGEGRSHIDIEWRRFWGNTIGEAQFPMNDCSDNIYCHLSQSYKPNDVQVGNLILHENGHNFGESHHSSGVMAPTISNGLTRIYWPEDDTAAIALREHYWQGDPNPPEPPTEPPPEREPDGTLTIDGRPADYFWRPE